MRNNFWKKALKPLGLALAASGFFAATAFAQLVTTSGFGPDREAALKDARRAATEQVIGTYLNSKSLVANNVVISDDIYTKTAGFVALRRVVAEGRADGGYRLTATFDVDTNPDSALMSQMELLVLLRDPRIAVVVFDKSGYNLHEETSEAAMNESLLRLGFHHVIDARTVTMLQDSAFLEAIYNGTSRRIGNTGIKGVDYFVIAKADAYSAPINIYGKTSSMLSGRAALTAKLIKADTGDIIGNFNVDGTGVDINEMMATRKALMAAGEAAGQKIEQTFRRHAASVNAGVVVEAEGRASEIQALARDLKAAAGVQNVIIREVADGRGIIEVETTLDPSELFRALRTASRLGLILDGVSGSTLRVTVL